MINKTILASVQLPPLVVALALAEAFFKFHSFTLETLAFLGVWYALRRVYEPIERQLRERLAMRLDGVASAAGSRGE